MPGLFLVALFAIVVTARFVENRKGEIANSSPLAEQLGGVPGVPPAVRPDSTGREQGALPGLLREEAGRRQSGAGVGPSIIGAHP